MTGYYKIDGGDVSGIPANAKMRHTVKNISIVLVLRVSAALCRLVSQLFLKPPPRSIYFPFKSFFPGRILAQTQD